MTGNASAVPEAINPWPIVAAAAPPPDAPGERARLLARLSTFLPVHLAAHLLGVPTADPAARRDHLAARFLRHRYATILDDLAGAGIHIVAFKGYANAFTLYPEPELRLVGDLDVLLPARAIPKAMAVLADHGLHADPTPSAGPFGFTGRKSFAPITDAAGLVNVDLHTEVDEAPLPKALPADRVVERAHWHPDARCSVPDRETTAVILVSHAARQRFGPYTVKNLLDLTRLLPAGPHPADWHDVARLARRADLDRPLTVALALLQRLDVPTAPLPDRLADRVAARAKQRSLALLTQRWLTGFPESEGSFPAKLLDELRFGPVSSVLVSRQLVRLAGLFRPGRGQPPGAR